MRFLLYDRVTSLSKGRSITGVKTFGLADESLRGHFGRTPVVPTTMLVEAMAQLLGWAVIHAHDFQLAAILCLVDGATFSSARLRPGFIAELGGEILANGSEDSLGRAWMDVDGVRLASINRVIFRHFRPVRPRVLQRTFAYCSGLEGDESGERGDSTS
jgi:3-hydroxyacyl-[acyl-carrier-protein] dehydratase